MGTGSSVASSQLFFARALKWYKRPDVQQAIARAAKDREVGVKYGPGFGKRPDVIVYPGDVLEFAKKKVTSFHCSEERWSDPLAIQTGARRKELDALRSGWDLVLDIDCPYWEFAKLTAHLFIKALQDHGISAITCKFSGNKGFHIGVPFEAFPEMYGETPTKELFPEGPRAIAQYLLDYIGTKLITVTDNLINFGDAKSISFSELQQLLPTIELLTTHCPLCKKKWEESKTIFVCPSCGARDDNSQEEFKKCVDCGVLMEKFEERSCACGLPPTRSFNVSALIEVDTILLASRHLYRSPYSLHEKSKLASIVIPVDKTTILNFEKASANPDTVTSFPEFLPRDIGAARGEGANLLAKALVAAEDAERAAAVAAGRTYSGAPGGPGGQGGRARKEFEAPEEAVPEEYFPPCMQQLLAGLNDGRKRALFILTNFLRSVGWPPELVEKRLYEWNEENDEPLREVNIKGHLRLKQRQGIVLPPNCSSDYYKALRVCHPDASCRARKNPARAAIIKYRDATGVGKKGARAKLTDEQKAMRKAYRERLRREKEEEAKEARKQGVEGVEATSKRAASKGAASKGDVN